MKARMDEHSMHQFAATQSDRSDLGMSNASSMGLPGVNTLRGGINLPGHPSQVAAQNNPQ